MTAIVEFEATSAACLHATLGSRACSLPNLGAVSTHLRQNPGEHAVVLGPSVDLQSALDLARSMRVTHNRISVILVRHRIDSALLSDALRAGVREVVTEDNLSALASADSRAHDLATDFDIHGHGSGATADAASDGTVITVFAAKGGAGKTTIATNLAAILSERENATVALVDLDLAFGDAAIAMSLEPAHSIADAIPMADTLDAAGLRALMTTHITGVSLLAAPSDPSLAESVSAAVVERALSVLSMEFDYVVVDCPPALNDSVLAALDASDVVALLATLDVPSLKNLRLALNTLDLLAFPADRLRILLNRSDAKVGLNVDDVQKAVGVTLTTRIPSSADVPHSTNRGVILGVDQPAHPVSVAIREFAERHVQHRAPTSSATLPSGRPTGRRWLLRRRTAA
ncbi:MAG: AAA family ATPase [Actinomycetes bacterium]